MSKPECISDTVTNQLEKGNGNALEESNLVDWDGIDDPTNPRNRSKHKKWTHIVIISVLALTTNMAPTMCAPGISGASADLGITSNTVSTLAITLYALGLAIGPMFMSPLSGVYGCVPVYHIGNIIFVAFVIGNALSRNVAQFLVFRSAWQAAPGSSPSHEIIPADPLADGGCADDHGGEGGGHYCYGGATEALAMRKVVKGP